jgi:hypothetical protein
MIIYCMLYTPLATLTVHLSLYEAFYVLSSIKLNITLTSLLFPHLFFLKNSPLYFVSALDGTTEEGTTSRFALLNR